MDKQIIEVFNTNTGDVIGYFYIYPEIKHVEAFIKALYPDIIISWDYEVIY